MKIYRVFAFTKYFLNGIFISLGLFLAINPTIPDKPMPEFPIISKAMLKKMDAKQLACLTKNIFYEAGSEPIVGQAAVARVVLNRMAHGFAKNPCDVVYQKTQIEKEDEDGDTYTVTLCQFSWVCEGKKDPDKNHPKYKQAERVARAVLLQDAYRDLLPRSVLFFHNTSVDPLWPYKRVATIGNHIFYSKEKKHVKKTK